MTSALLPILRAYPGDLPAVARAAQTAEASELLQSSGRHGLTALIHRAIVDSGAQVPELALLQRQALALSAQALRVKTLLFAALDALAARGIVPVLLKGYGLAARLYPDPLLRPSTDVDLWVTSDELSPATEALATLGLTRATPLKRRDEHDRHHLELVGKRGMVELHYAALATFGRTLETDPFRARATEAVLDGRRVRYLAPADELVYLSAHATHHLLQRLSWLYDLKLHIARASPEWPAVIDSARQSGASALVFFALRAAQRALGAGVPDDALAALSPGRARIALFDRLFDEDRLVDAYYAQHRWAWALAKVALADDMRALGRLAWGRVVGPQA